MEQQKRRPWRRWVVLALMILGCVLGGGLAGLGIAGIPPVQPEISVKPENLLGEGVAWFKLPFLGNFELVNTLPTLVGTVILIVIIAYFTNRSLKRSAETDLVPRGIGGLMEAYFELLYNLTESSAGAKWVRLIFPWFATIMTYVLFANLIRLLPGFESIGVLHHAENGHAISPLAGNWNLITSAKGAYMLVPFLRGVSIDLNFTAALAIVAVIAVQVVGIRAQGMGYFSKFFNVRRMFTVPFFGAMDFLVGLLEIISELSRVLSFAFRLFGNMFAGLVLVAIASALLGFVSIIPAMLFMFELFVGVIQAFVFGMLTMVFMAQATQGHGEEHAEA